MLTFALDPAELPSERVARVALEAVSEGSMGRFLNAARYASFLDIWNMSEDYSHLIDKLHSGAVLAGVKTSCAVDASAVLGYCGHKLNKPWHADGSWGITSWLGLDFKHPAWVPAFKDGVPVTPRKGWVFYRGSMHGTNGHVGILSLPGPDGKWWTVEGGGWLTTSEQRGMTPSQIKATNGTVMRRSAAPKDIFAKDSLGRLPTGFWDTDLIGLPTWEEALQRVKDANG